MTLTIASFRRPFHCFVAFTAGLGAERSRLAVLGLMLVAVIAQPGSGHAQQLTAPDADLAVLDTVRVTASQTTPDAVPCGIDLRLLLPIVQEQLQDGGLRTAESPGSVVTFSLMTAHEPASRLCGTTAMLGAYRLVSYFDEAAGWLKSGYVVLWQRGSQVMSSPTDHPLATERVLTQLVDSLLDSWRAQRRSTEPSN